MIRAELRDLSVPDADMDALAQWLASGQGLPSLDALNTPEGQLYARAVHLFVDQTIQNPRRADKPSLSNTAWGRIAYAISSFIYTFFRNVHLATLNRAMRNYGIARTHGASKGEAVATAGVEASASFVVGFAALFVGQLLVGTMRAAIFNGAQWDEHEKDDDLFEWLSGLAFSRTGIMGPNDILFNALTGLRYERDLTTLAAGPGASYLLSQVQNILRGLPKTEFGYNNSGVGLRNSGNTNTAEHTALKAAYRLSAAPAAAWGLAALGQVGPVGNVARYLALTYLTSTGAATTAADALVGPKGTSAE